MITKIKAIIAGAFALILAGLYFMVGHRTRQRDEERRRADGAERSYESADQQREDSGRISDAQSEARESNEQHRQSQNEKPDSERRTGRLGGLDRVRDYDRD